MCSMENVAICMVIMALTTYLIRLIPIGFVRKKMETNGFRISCSISRSVCFPP